MGRQLSRVGVKGIRNGAKARARIRDAQMDMNRMTRRKALNTGMREAERAAMMFLRLERRPKMRMTRKARTTRRMETGMSIGPREITERPMTTQSMRLYWLVTNGLNQWA